MRRAPSSIYRLQLTEAFTISDATRLLPYLKHLGVEGVYCSPYFNAYSPHGYDVTDPNALNPKLSTEGEYAQFCRRLKGLGFFHIADVVPNHMGIKGENRWWQDVLEKGRESKFAKFFDIDWSKGKILVPILAEDRTVEQEHYRLVPWWTSATKTSYRRFFAINELIGIRIEDPHVLRAHHALLFSLLKEKKIDGLRIDHPDGLLDPAGYFNYLRKRHKGLIFAEKILGFKEELPHEWNVDGTVGYDFSHMLTGLFIQKSSELTRIYESFIGRKQDFDEMLYQNRKCFLKREMLGDIDNLATTLPAPCGKEALKAALIELLSVFPVYRTYIKPTKEPCSKDLAYIKSALDRARKRAPLLQETFDHLDTVFRRKEYRPFVLKFQQLCVPAMAKGFEDTTLYQYNRLLALNDVGFAPEKQGITKGEFHTFCQRKRATYPLGILSSSTHDSKRSMDVRMLLATLADIPQKWEEVLKTFARLNALHKTAGSPERNHEYFLYQTILGVWPSKPTTYRLWQSFQKSMRESKEQTNWRSPNRRYEAGCAHFLRMILKKKSPFIEALNAFYKQIIAHGRYNSLAAVALKLACPGIVDIYQGCEHFLYRLMDPDNRMPVTFDKQPDIKAELHKKALHFRQKHKSLFLEGEYIPLRVAGSGSEHVVAFLRKKGAKQLLVAAARFSSSMDQLEDVIVHLPKPMKSGLDLFSQRRFKGKEIRAQELFHSAPFAWVFNKAALHKPDL